MKRRAFIALSTQAFTIPLIFLQTTTNARSSVTLKKKFAPDTFPLQEITLDKLRLGMETGTYSSRSITELYLKRIAEVDKKGPMLNAVIEINSQALELADKMDAERKQGKVRSALHGIPVLIKDNINTADTMMTTAGSLALEGHRASNDAFIVQQLRNAGAVILGKTNLSEWANFRSTRSVSGWSSRGAQTKNPYVLDRNPCGSSSGSGTAVAANLCAVAIGTETNGSIACPSSINGIVGIKPTVGLVSRAGIIPISHTQDTAGPMTRTVRDAAIVLTVLAGVDPQDPITQESKGRLSRDYTLFLDEDGLKGKRIGVEKSFLKRHEKIDPLLEKALTQMRSKGATIVEVDLLEKIKIEGAEFTLLQYEFKDGLNRYLANSKAAVHSLKELIAFNTEHSEKVMPFFGQEILERSQERAGLDDKVYKEALQKITGVREIIDKVLKAENLDALCGPTNGPAWCTDLINGDHFTGYGMYSPAAMAGYPHITVPMGYVHDLPVGITFFGGAFHEPELISIAYAYEQASKNRVAPSFVQTMISK